MKQMMHTPEGVRDIYNSECARKLSIENKIRGVMNSYGYEDIQTPTFEFFEIFKMVDYSISDIKIDDEKPFIETLIYRKKKNGDTEQSENKT